MTRCNASTFWLELFTCERRSSLAVSSSLSWSSSSSSSSCSFLSPILLLLLLALLDGVPRRKTSDIVFWLLLLVLVLLSLANDKGLCLRATLPGSPVLPLPVELVAGGDGSPESLELWLETGLSGSGRSGRLPGAPLARCGDGDEVWWISTALPALAVLGLCPLPR